MAFSLKKDEVEARERLRAFWNGSSLGRPALYIVSENPNFVEKQWEGPDLSHKEKDLLPEWQTWYNEALLTSMCYHAEAMPGTSFPWGSFVTTLPVLAGGEYGYSEEVRYNFFPSTKTEKIPTAWIEHDPSFLYREPTSFNPEMPIVKTLDSLIEANAKMVDGRGYINPPMFIDGLTTISLFIDPSKLAMELLENPERVKLWSSALTNIFIEGYEHFYQMMISLGYKDTSSWLPTMAEGRFEAVQCDFGVMLSPKMYREFAIPDLERVTDYLDYSLYHLDGTEQLRFLKLLAGLRNLNGIQWNPEPNAGSPLRWIKAFKEVRSHRLSLFVSCKTTEEAIELTRSLGPDGLMIELPIFETADEAEDAIKKIERVSR